MSWNEWKTPDNLVRSLLALYLVIGGTAWVLSAEGTGIGERWAIAGGLVGAVLGYYFGSRGVDKAEERAASALVSGKTDAMLEAKGDIVGLAEDLKGARAVLAAYDEFLADKGLATEIDEFLSNKEA